VKSEDPKVLAASVAAGLYAMCPKNAAGKITWMTVLAHFCSKRIRIWEDLPYYFSLLDNKSLCLACAQQILANFSMGLLIFHLL